MAVKIGFSLETKSDYDLLITTLKNRREALRKTDPNITAVERQQLKNEWDGLEKLINQLT